MFIKNHKVYTSPINFIAGDKLTAHTMQGVKGKVYKAGQVYPANDATAIGIVYETVDATENASPVAVMTHGDVYESRLPEKVSEEAKAKLTRITFLEYNAQEGK